MADFLDLEEMYDVHKKKDKTKLQIYGEIYLKCLEKMRQSNTVLGKLECNFTVPSFIWGIPIYDYEDLKQYILFKLHRNGLVKSCLVDNTTIYISWKPEDIDKKLYQQAKKDAITETTDLGSNVKTISNSIPRPRTTGPATAKKTQHRPQTNTSAMMKFGDIYEVPVNMDKINRARNSGSITTEFNYSNKPENNITQEQQYLDPNGSNHRPQRPPPSRHLLNSWSNYFNQFKKDKSI